MGKMKVDLTLLKRLVSELETSVSTMDTLGDKTFSKENGVELAVEASKAAGVAAGVMQEAGMLILDIQNLVQGSQMSKSKSDLMEKIMGTLKGPGTSN
jgi:hypothetical protein